MPSRTTWITWLSWQFRRLQNGGITPWFIKRSTWSRFPLIVKLLIAHAASLLVWNSPWSQTIIYLFIFYNNKKRHTYRRNPSFMVSGTDEQCLLDNYHTSLAISVMCIWKISKIYIKITFDRLCIIFGIRPASITAWTWCWFPAVMLDKNQTASCKEIKHWSYFHSVC